MSSRAAGTLAVLVAIGSSFGSGFSRTVAVSGFSTAVPPVEAVSQTVSPAVVMEFLDPSAPLWGVEGDRTSIATFSRGNASGRSALVFRYELGPGRPAAQFAALVASVPHGLSQYDRITFRARASRPLRLAVTLRPAGTHNPPRWQRSVYLDQTPRTVTVFFDDMHVVPGQAAGPAPLASIGALMFIIDTNNTKPGTSGEITLSEIAYAH